MKIKVKVKPNSKQQKIEEDPDGVLVMVMSLLASLLAILQIRGK